MNKIQVFSNAEFGKVRTIIREGEPWFVGNDVAKALGYKKINEALNTNVDEMDSALVGVIDTLGREQQTKIINESGLYTLIFGSKLPNAKKFKRWVTSEVLPSIRKTGSYNAKDAMPTTNEGKIQLLAQHQLEIAENIRKIDAKADDIKTELEEFKETMPLLPIEADEIVKAIKKKGVEVMGGVDTLAYKDRGTRSAVYRDIHAQLWREFGVTSYKAIAHKYLQKAFEVVEAYKLPTTLIDRINEANLKATA